MSPTIKMPNPPLNLSLSATSTHSDELRFFQLLMFYCEPISVWLSISRTFHLISARLSKAEHFSSFPVWLSISWIFQLILVWLSSRRTFSLLPGAGAGADSLPDEFGIVIKEQELWGHIRGGQGPAKQGMEHPWISHTPSTGFSWSSRKTAPELLMFPGMERKCSRNWKKQFSVWVWAEGAHVGNP